MHSLVSFCFFFTFLFGSCTPFSHVFNGTDFSVKHTYKTSLRLRHSKRNGYRAGPVLNCLYVKYNKQKKELLKHPDGISTMLL